MTYYVQLIYEMKNDEVAALVTFRQTRATGVHGRLPADASVSAGGNTSRAALFVTLH
jgi:hypothetical protein